MQQLLCQYINEELQVQNLDAEDMTKVTSRWVLSNLTATLKHHLMYNCIVRKYGTLLYRPQVDLKPALAQALWRSQNIDTQSTNENYTSSSSTKLYNLTFDTELLRELNTQIHSQVKEVLSKDAVAVVNHDQIDINYLIDEIPPKLWQAVNITLLTESVSERRGTSIVSKTDSASYHIKRIRRVFLLCCMMFITDDRCSIPLHILIADLVGQGGSAWLHKILNRLGVCASADTLSQFIQNKGTTVDMSDLYANDNFTFISADNIDFLHKHARDVRGNGNSSWHGTTIQLVQPLPSFSLFCPSGPAN